MVKKHVYPIVLTIAATAALYTFLGSTNGQRRVENVSVTTTPAPAVKKPVSVVKPNTDDSHALSGVEQYESHKIDSFFIALNKHARFNGNVLVAHNGKILYQSSFGGDFTWTTYMKYEKYKYYCFSIKQLE